jgi:adenosylcobyric acid synthase
MKTLMIQGTTSDAGKSTLVAALCRIFVNLGFNVAPFKPQNMALNSAVTADGGEIGRAQALQAIAANLEPRIDFNPILLKPNSDTGAQVIVHGKALSNMEATGYHDYKKVAMNAVLESHQRLAKEFDLLMVEGAGSPAEVNLRENDIANMGYAEAVDCPVILVADIDRGGVFAHLVGTLSCLSESEQSRVKGFIINRFRGDIKLLESGLDWLEEKTGKPVLGVVPYLHDLALDAEDAIAIDNTVTVSKITILVPLLPHMSNHTDFDALRLSPEIDLRYIKMGESISHCDLILLPGSKNVISDLKFLKEQGWQADIQRHLRYGGKVFGICGGYQMMGELISDPLGIEVNWPNNTSVENRKTAGLGLLAFTTELTQEKTLIKLQATMTLSGKQCEVSGYEIHCGISQGQALKQPLLSKLSSASNENSFDGCISSDNQIAGTYLHGLFDEAAATELVMHWVNEKHGVNQVISLDEHREKQLIRLASVCQQHLDISKITEIIQHSVSS